MYVYFFYIITYNYLCIHLHKCVCTHVCMYIYERTYVSMNVWIYLCKSILYVSTEVCIHI